MTKLQSLPFVVKRHHASRSIGRSRRTVQIYPELNSGLPVAAIISADEHRRFVAAETQREARVEAIGRISGAFADVPVDELERQVTRALGKARPNAGRGELAVSPRSFLARLEAGNESTPESNVSPQPDQ